MTRVAAKAERESGAEQSVASRGFQSSRPSVEKLNVGRKQTSPGPSSGTLNPKRGQLISGLVVPPAHCNPDRDVSSQRKSRKAGMDGARHVWLAEGALSCSISDNREVVTDEKNPRSSGKVLDHQVDGQAATPRLCNLGVSFPWQ